MASPDFNTHRVAISNRRIEAMGDGKVAFWYKDYRKNRIKSRQMKLDAEEFIRRFLWHVLPKRYHKIRHYGFLANSCRKARVSQIRSLLQIESDTSEAGPKKETGIKCSACGSGRMQPRIIIDRFGRLISRGLDFKTNEAFDTS